MKLAIMAIAAWVGWVHTTLMRLSEEVARLGYNKMITVTTHPIPSLFSPQERERVTLQASPLIFPLPKKEKP